MITIHATKKLLDKLKVLPVKDAAVNSGRLGPWYADVRVVNRKYLVYALNEQSLLCVVVPLMSFKADAAGSIRTALRPVLEAIGLPDAVIIAELSAIDTATFTKTISRVTLGRLNSAVDISEALIYGGKTLDAVCIRLAAHLYSAGKGHSSSEYLWPYQIVGSLLGHPTRSPMRIASPPIEHLTSIAVDQSRPVIEPQPILKDRLILRIVLDGIRPEIWRMIMVPDTITLRRLHDVIQAAMGWDESHLHLFKINGKEYGDREMFDDSPEMKDERFTSLQSMHLTEGNTFTYVYDMGGDWSHTITVVDYAAVEIDETLHILDGANAVPPEDVGGVPGYARFVLAMMDPKHEDHEECMQWYGRPFDHTMFDLRGAIRLLSVLEYTGAGYPWKRKR